MPIPDFVRDLRARVGSEHELWLAGVAAVVVRDAAVLLVRRADTSEWSCVTGIVEPGEHPAVTAVRETAEEAGVEVVVEALVGVDTTATIVHENGDRARYLNLTFRCRWVFGEPHPADGEATAAGWYPIAALPEPLAASDRERIASALDPDPARLIG